MARCVFFQTADGKKIQEMVLTLVPRVGETISLIKGGTYQVTLIHHQFKDVGHKRPEFEHLILLGCIPVEVKTAMMIK